MSARNFVLDTLPANTFVRHSRHGHADVRAAPEQRQGVDPQSIRSVQARLTWQMSPKNKLAGLQRSPREEPRCGDDGRASTRPTASIVWTSPIYTTGSVKFSSTATSKILIEGGFSTNYERYNTLYQPGLEKERGTPEWYTAVNKTDTARGTPWNAGATNQGMYPDRFAAMGAVSYVTGAHNVKVGVQDTWGRYRQFRSAQRRPARHLHQRRAVPRPPS